jgi:tRNA (guanine26-N2/guanine27-N2)-dimethyltransferase
MHSVNLDSTQLNSERPPNVVVHDGKEYNSVREGLATILNPHKSNGTSNEPLPGASSQAVFYNPVQQFNRDLSVLAIRVFA